MLVRLISSDVYSGEQAMGSLPYLCTLRATSAWWGMLRQGMHNLNISDETSWSVLKMIPTKKEKMPMEGLK